MALRGIDVGLFKSIGDTYRELGFASGMVYLLDQALQRVAPNSGIFFYDWTVQPITDSRLIPEKRAVKYTHRIIKGDDPLCQEMPVRPEILRERVKQQAECVALFKGEALVGFIWFTFGTYIEDEVRLDFLLEPKDQSVFDFNLYIFPKYRLGYAFSAIWDVANRSLYERGYRYSYSRITHIKRNSFSSHSKLGAQKIGSSLTLKMGKFEFTLVHRPFRLFFSLSPKKRLRVKMRPQAPTQDQGKS